MPLVGLVKTVHGPRGATGATGPSGTSRAFAATAISVPITSAGSFVITKTAVGSRGYLVTARVEIPFTATANSLVGCAMQAQDGLTNPFVDVANTRVGPISAADPAYVNIPLVGSYMGSSAATPVNFVFACRTNVAGDTRTATSAQLTILAVDNVQ